MRVETYLVEKNVYITSDGTRFDSRQDAEKYERGVNPFGVGSNEYWKFEAKRRGFKTPGEMLQFDKERAPRCQYCGTPAGFSFGTGDCGCSGDDY